MIQFYVTLQELKVLIHQITSISKLKTEGRIDLKCTNAPNIDYNVLNCAAI